MLESASSIAHPRAPGKPTTTTLTVRNAHGSRVTLRVAALSGTRLCAQAESSTPDTLHVIEVAAFGSEQIVSFRPWIAVTLELSPDHLVGTTVEAYAAAKQRVFENQAVMTSVVNADDEPTMTLTPGRRQHELFSRRVRLMRSTVIESGWWWNG